jgi:CxxC-x17-CxxC domain-containing protein
MYQRAACGDHSYNLKFCTTCTTNNTNLEYCGHCTGSKDSFGCVGLRKKQHCILNKQYTKDEYETLKARIVEHMNKSGEYGEYFPIELCPYAYNETIAMEYFPLTREEAATGGLRWREPNDDMPNVKRTVPADRLPEEIADVPDDILNWAITCSESGRPFRVVQRELAFYRQQDLPIPHLHPDLRHSRRQSRRTGVRLFTRSCSKCDKEIQTTFTPDRPETVYCEECYHQAIY